MSLDSLEIAVIGGVIRLIQGLLSAAPTLLAGLFVAATLRYYIGAQGTRRLFGGDSLRSLPQSWLIGMLLPVCSIGVLPILMEMRRVGVKAGAISAFALSAPLFNPLSLLYGLTLSRPMVVIMFALGSLIVVTLVGLIWDRRTASPSTDLEASTDSEADQSLQGLIGVRRLFAVLLYITRSLAGSVGALAIIGVLGLFLLGTLLAHGELQTRVERDDWKAPATMMLVAIPAYATPMLAMSQLGMMFQHANSPGAAFVLLVLGTGMNLATIVWLARNFGGRSVMIWLGCVLTIVLSIAYAINRPLIPVGVEPAGHTHAFDIYTNPLHQSEQISSALLRTRIVDDTDPGEQLAGGFLGLLFLLGAVFRALAIDERWLLSRTSVADVRPGGLDRIVPPQVVGGVMIAGLIAISVVMCYGYYPAPNELLKEISVARAECLTAANSGQIEHATYWLEIWDDLSRRLEVGTFLRKGEVRKYQRMQGYLIRKKLELLEHELEHDPFEPEQTKRVVRDILATNQRWVTAFRN